ncbi:MAG: serine/threonine phosphatase [Pseudonocardiales bacterium]|nr:serine/threonine phosphatase [Pseudonocardiales bacterium]
MSVAQRLVRLFQAGERSDRNVAAAALQRSLMPDGLPQIDGLRLAARYVPAEGDLGGDWYDVFCLPDGSVGVVMGDVMGHGFASAVIMGRLRSSLRSYALDHADPAEVLSRLDRKIEYFEPGAMATVLYGVCAAPFDTMRFSNAGHLPPIMATPDGGGVFVDLPPDLPMGVSLDHPRRTTEVRLPMGAALCLFTDGLVEQRLDPHRQHGSIDSQLERVRRAVTTDEPATVVDRLIAELPDPDNPDDDVAVLVIRRGP